MTNLNHKNNPNLIEDNSASEEKGQKSITTNNNTTVTNNEDENLTNTGIKEIIPELELVQENNELVEAVLSHQIKTLDKKTKEIVIKQVRDLIDSERDIYFLSSKGSPIIKETGFKKLVAATGAEFLKTIPLEKPSEAPSKDRQQAWIQTTAKFPDGSLNEEYGVANFSNCKDDISQANLPIMALKRARSRAFFRSEYIGLYQVYDENENSYSNEQEKERNAALNTQIKNLNQSIKSLKRNLDIELKKNINLIDILCKETTTEIGQIIWEIEDVEILEHIRNNDESKVRKSVAKLKLEEMRKVKPFQKKEDNTEETEHKMTELVTDTEQSTDEQEKDQIEKTNDTELKEKELIQAETAENNHTKVDNANEKEKSNNQNKLKN